MGGKLEPQPHGGALSRGGRKPGSKNRPKPLLDRIRKQAGRKCSRAVTRLAAIMDNPDTAPADAIRAASLILAYGIGRPVAMDEPGFDKRRAYEVTARILGIEPPE